MNTHDLKTHPLPFEAVWNGDKPFEIRKNDRNFQVGDRVRLSEWNPETELFHGRYVVAVIGYLVPGGAWGLGEDLCVFALREVRRFRIQPWGDAEVDSLGGEVKPKSACPKCGGEFSPVVYFANPNPVLVCMKCDTSNVPVAPR